MTSNLLPIRDIAAQLGLGDDELFYYGPHTAKVKLDLLTDANRPPRGKLIMVTAITPTTFGEGKTVTSIGLSLGIARLGKKVLLTSREPSLGPVFGLKGGATGAGRAQVLPAERINLHFTGDFHAITTAHNLIAAALDAHIHHGNLLRLDVGQISWPRALDMNDRALREIIVGLGGKSNGVPRETGFVITAASEIMAIMSLASSHEDLRRRLDNILLGFQSRRPTRPRPRFGHYRRADGAFKRSHHAQSGADERKHTGFCPLRPFRQHRAWHEQRYFPTDGLAPG